MFLFEKCSQSKKLWQNCSTIKQKRSFLFEKLSEGKKSILKILNIFANIENTKTFKFIINEIKKIKKNFKDENLKSSDSSSITLDYDTYSIKKEINNLLKADQIEIEKYIKPELEKFSIFFKENLCKKTTTSDLKKNDIFQEFLNEELDESIYEIWKKILFLKVIQNQTLKEFLNKEKESIFMKNFIKKNSKNKQIYQKKFEILKNEKNIFTEILNILEDIQSFCDERILEEDEYMYYENPTFFYFSIKFEANLGGWKTRQKNLFYNLCSKYNIKYFAKENKTSIALDFILDIIEKKLKLKNKKLQNLPFYFLYFLIN